MKIGSTPITDIKVGSTQITKVIRNGITYWSSTPQIVDIDGNVYTSVIIGTQEWMVENLKTTRYKDGTVIPTGLSNANWAAENGTAGHDGSFSWPNNDIANKTPYGGDYNSFAGQNVHGLAPDGWKLPSISDVFYLLNKVGDSTAKLKETGVIHWASPNIGATNESGWSGIPTGNRYVAGIHSPINSEVGVYLTRTSFPDSPPPYCFYYILQHQDVIFRQEAEKGSMGVAVRCMRYTSAEVIKERLDSRWCAINAIPAIWDYTDGGWTSDGIKLSCDGSGTYIALTNNFFAFPEKVHVSITVNRISGSLIPPYDGITEPMTISASGTYEYDLDYTDTVGLSLGLFISHTNFIGSITTLSIIGKYE